MLKFSVQLPTDRVDQARDFGSADAITQIARAIERAGFDACYVTDHPFPPEHWLARGGHHALDPFVSLALVAAATRTLRLHTNVLILAYRNPFLTAKAIASLDAVSGGRVGVGAGAGYLSDEFAALGASYEDRNERFDEAIRAMQAAWTGEPVLMSGADFRVESHRMRPRPVQRPHPPIWIGGNSPRAIRRAVALGQGWSPFPLPASGAGAVRTSAIESIGDLASGIERLRVQAEREGRREPLDVNFVPFGLAMNVRSMPEDEILFEQFAALEAIGVTWVSIGLPTSSRGLYLESLARFAETFLSSHER